jgi:hypothetical protein
VSNVASLSATSFCQLKPVRFVVICEGQLLWFLEKSSLLLRANRELQFSLACQSNARLALLLRLSM